MLSLFVFSKFANSYEEIITKPVTVNNVFTSWPVNASTRVKTTEEIKKFLIDNDVDKESAERFSNKMKFSNSVHSIIHEFTMNQCGIQFMRPAEKTAAVVHVTKQNNAFDVSIITLKATTSVCALVTKKTWDVVLFKKVNEKITIDTRPLTGKDIENINDAFESKMRPLIEPYLKY
jgi:hypothetical protein